MGVFNPNATITADLNLLFQIAILVFLVVGVWIAKLKRRYVTHGTVMGIAVGLNTVSLAVVMLPSFVSFRGLFSMPFTSLALAVFVHATMGSLAEILGIWLVATWMFRHQQMGSCAQKKNIMRATIVLWFAELLIGVYIYIMLYLPI